MSTANDQAGQAQAHEASQQAELKVSEEYNDPKADVAVISNDNVHFKIQSYYLKAFR